jgi:hypothetical protein
VRLDLQSLIYGLSSTFLSLLHQISRHLGLAVDHDAFSTRQTEKINPVVTPIERQGKSVMREALLMHSKGRTRPFKKLDSPLLQNAGADSTKDVVLAHSVQDNVVDARLCQELSQQKS